MYAIIFSLNVSIIETYYSLETILYCLDRYLNAYEWATTLPFLNNKSIHPQQFSWRCSV